MFSKHNPNLQLLWDATSLTALQKCPRFYQLRIQEGWRRPENTHLDFGSMLHEALETFQKARLGGALIPAATKEALRRVLQISGWYEGGEWGSSYTWTPWGGVYADRWRCTGTAPYKNEKGNKAKCPYSHAGKWQEAPIEITCPTCGSWTEIATHYLPDHPSKHRVSLLRMVAWFCDTQHETEGLQPYAFPDGTPAVELQGVTPVGRKAPGGDDDYLFVTNIDELATWRGRHYILDTKTTKNPLNPAFFRQFAPHSQLDLYDLFGSILYADLDIAGTAVRGIQVTKTGGAIATRLITKTEGQREEAWRDLNYWLDQAEALAATGYYPMNRASCRGCDFAGICDMDPEYRARTLAADFVQQRWHPVHRGGPVPEEEEE